MSFYLKPPRGVLNFHMLEKCAKQRQLFYDSPNNDVLYLSSFYSLIEDSCLDRSGHYLFRLLAYRDPSFREVFFENEKRLLLLRLNCYDKEDIRHFLKRLIKHLRDGLEEYDVHEALRELYNSFIKICLQMLRKSYLSHILDMSVLHGAIRGCNEFILRVPFTFCVSLLPKREKEINKGLMEFRCNEWKEVLVCLFETYLDKALQEMKFSQNVQTTVNDDRIKEVLELLRSHWFKNINGNIGSNCSSFDMRKIREESKLFPMCMLNLYEVLQKTNRLSHNERFDFTLYMKGIGISLADSLKFWEIAYSKQHASCSKCTHNWQENRKRYIYGIRHIYGLEGSRKNYQVRSCSYFQDKSLCATENGGCPFKHFDDNNLRKVLKMLLPNKEDEVEVMIYERKENPSESCKLFYENSLNLLSDKKIDDECIYFQNPVEYYLSLKSNLIKNDFRN